jgi:hypothetical protein
MGGHTDIISVWDGIKVSHEEDCTYDFVVFISEGISIYKVQFSVEDDVELQLFTLEGMSPDVIKELEEFRWQGVSFGVDEVITGYLHTFITNVAKNVCFIIAHDEGVPFFDTVCDRVQVI